jgi:formylglycine-generating enzyme required for sulfatase activity
MMTHPIRITWTLAAILAFGGAHVSLAHAASVTLDAGAIFRDCPQCPELVVVAPGEFVMGSTPEQSRAAQVREDTAAREWPARPVSIGKPFAIGRYEVTRGEYAAFVEATGREDGDACITWDQKNGKWQTVDGASWRRPGFPLDDQHPVGCLDLADSMAYVAWLSTVSGQRYRVPTEAEWEYVARAGATTMQTWGDGYDDVCRHANASELTRAEAHGGLKDEPTRFFNCHDGFVYSSPVGSFPPNPFGLYDVIGNVWEWVTDCYFETYKGAPSDGTAWIIEGCERRVVRGGAWYSRIWFLRPAARSREPPSFRSSTLGLRVLRELP